MTMTSPSSAKVPSLPLKRTVARPVANLGNTCYMNAVLQALAHAPELMQAMDLQAHRLVCPTAKENKAKQAARSPSSGTDEELKKIPAVAATRKSQRGGGRKTPPDYHENADQVKFCALCEVEEHFLAVHNNELAESPVAPSAFVDGFIQHVAPWFRLGVQEDSHEFLRLLIDSMQKSCLAARPSILEKDGDHEYPFELFRGTVESNVTCEHCKALSATRDPIEDVGLEVTVQNEGAAAATPEPRGSSSRNSSPSPALADVKTSFRNLIQAEALETYLCEKCNESTQATKQTRLASIPPILTLHLKRFRYGDRDRASRTRSGSRSELNLLLGQGGRSGSSKIEGHVKFETVLDLRPYLTEELQEQYKSTCMCRLFAVVVHAGKNSHSGHYIAYVRNICKNEWWKMDDRRVESTSEDEVLAAEAYMLFYRVLQHPVAIDLEKKYRQAYSEQEVAVVTRKRDASVAFESGTEWAENCIRLSSELFGFLDKAEELVADEVQWGQEMYAAIHEEAQAMDAAVGRGPKRVKPTEADVKSGFSSRARKLLTDLFYRISRHFDGDSSVSLQPPGEARAG